MDAVCERAHDPHATANGYLWGETVHAVIVARDGAALSDHDVRSYAREHLAGYKIPRSIDWIDELPKTGSGKILKRELRKPYWDAASI